MEISLTPEMEAALDRVAAQEGRPVQQLVQDLVESYLQHEDWFRLEVGKGLASLDRVSLFRTARLASACDVPFGLNGSTLVDRSR
jgi:predicted transcriptional regulator